MCKMEKKQAHGLPLKIRMVFLMMKMLAQSSLDFIDLKTSRAT